uniref:Intraflagellar transport protein 20 homolog n=1 Tax=Clastoptera arizonana TaxID=38151 RepID=A0A1B6CMI0_9HEMI
MSERLNKLGLHFDELNKVRVIEPEAASKSSELRDQCRNFVDNITHFQNIVDGFVAMTDTLAQEVEKEKLKAITTRNLINSMEKQREANEQQYHALIIEKTTELERLRIQLLSLQKTISEQQEVIDNHLLN